MLNFLNIIAFFVSILFLTVIVFFFLFFHFVVVSFRRSIHLIYNSSLSLTLSSTSYSLFPLYVYIRIIINRICYFFVTFISIISLSLFSSLHVFFQFLFYFISINAFLYSSSLYPHPYPRL